MSSMQHSGGHLNVCSVQGKLEGRFPDTFLEGFWIWSDSVILYSLTHHPFRWVIVMICTNIHAQEETASM